MRQDKQWIPVSFLIALVAVTYVNSLWGQFVFDDTTILSNSLLTDANSWLSLLHVHAPRWPLLLTYAVDKYIWGINPVGYHLTSIVLHMINTLMVYCIIRRLSFNNTGVAVVGGSIFGVHSLLSEGVSYVSGRSSLLCGTFYFAAILLWVMVLERSRKRVIITYLCLLGIAVCMALAWFTKQEAITLPLALVIVYVVVGRKPRVTVIALALSSLLFMLVPNIASIKGLVSETSENKILVTAGFDKPLPQPEYLFTYLHAITTYYMPRVVLPIYLSADPDIAPVTRWWMIAGDILILGGLFILAIGTNLKRWQGRMFCVGILTMMASPLLAYSVMPLADVVLEHRFYITGLSIAMLFVWALSYIEERYRNIASTLIIMALMVTTISRNSVWATGTSVWEDAKNKAPNKPRIYLNLGEVYQREGRFDLALLHYDRALELKPNIYAAYSNKGSLFLDQALMLYQNKRLKESSESLQQSEYWIRKSIETAPQFQEGWINLATFHIRTGDGPGAIEILNKALDLGPNYMIYVNKGEAYRMMGQIDKAIDEYKIASGLAPNAMWVKAKVMDAERQKLALTR